MGTDNKPARYVLEVWLRGYARDHLREISTEDSSQYHPHITLVRPFTILTTPEHIKSTLTNYCLGQRPIPFELEGKSTFDPQNEEDPKIRYIPVTQAQGLQAFEFGLEKALGKSAEFFPRLDSVKNLHAFVHAGDEIPYVEKIEQFMLRLTLLKNKRIDYTFDFVRQEELSRKDALDRARWLRTVHDFEAQSGLVRTKDGFKQMTQD